MKTRNRFAPTVPQNPLDRAFKYLAIRNRSTKEMSDYLLKKGYSENEVEETIQKLLKLKFLNDEDFARTFAESHQRQGKSKKHIAFELKLKGVSRDETEEVLESTQDDLKTANDYILKRIHQFDRFSKEERQKKIIYRLRTRGYNWDVISKVLKKIS